MSSSTPLGFPYPVGTDRVMDGDDAIKALAEKIDAVLGVAAAGTVQVAIANGANSGSMAVTYPVGRFAATPAVVAVVSQASTTWVCGTNIGSATGFNVTVFARDAGVNAGSALNLNTNWIARTPG